jgi:nicotinamidase-related amidase
MVVDIDAIVVVDLIEVFVNGKMGDRKFKGVVEQTNRVISETKKFAVLVQDAHRSEDPEMNIWGEHAMDGSKEAETVEELKWVKPVLKKRTYDAFFNTELEMLLRARNAKNLLFCGVVTDICIVHSVASAFFRGFNTIVARECTSTYSEDDKRDTLEYMAKNYGTKIISITDIL